MTVTGWGVDLRDICFDLLDRCSTRLMNLHHQIDINMTLFVHGELSLQKQCVTALGGGQY